MFIEDLANVCEAMDAVADMQVHDRINLIWHDRMKGGG